MTQALDAVRVVEAARITVVGSANVDLVARCARLPAPGETIGDAAFSRIAGGKGANQAVAAARLGASVSFVGRVGTDSLVVDSLAAAGVDVSRVCRDDGESGVALILVDDEGENVIVVAPGANGRLEPGDVAVGEADAVLCQLEIPLEAVEAAAHQASFFCLNAAPALPVPVELIRRADLVIVNRYELDALAETPRLTALTLGGGRGPARARERGRPSDTAEGRRRRRHGRRRCLLRGAPRLPA